MNGIFVASDETLKTDIEPLTNAMDIIMQLSPKTYRFRTEEFQQMALPEGMHAGLIAPAVEEVLPQLVSSTRVESPLNDDGSENIEPLDYKALNYTGLVPYLIGAIQEQQATIQAQNERLSQMEQTLAACCAGPRGSDTRGAEKGVVIEVGSNATEALRIQPNPMIDRTTVFYSLLHSGRVRLIVNGTDGKELGVLQDATQEQGAYQFEWNTADLSPGVYYVTLLLDGAPIVKKAVKVAH